jgi:hypothetical protein
MLVIDEPVSFYQLEWSRCANLAWADHLCTLAALILNCENVATDCMTRTIK